MQLFGCKYIYIQSLQNQKIFETLLHDPSRR